MPTYEYECESCAHRFEAVQKMIDAPLTKCPVCNKKIHRVLSGGIGISFQGSGFYINDSKKQEKPVSEKKPSTKPPPSEEKPPVPARPAACEHCDKAAS
jgi:putative FmdB family regulatory protein